MLLNQKGKFRIPSNVTYLNGAYMSPSLKSVEKVGHEAITQKCFPYEIAAKDFFVHSENLRKQFAAFIGALDYQNTAIIPSASYALANVANNIKLKSGEEIIVADEQFPSNIYPWQKVADKNDATLKMITPPSSFENRGKIWNEKILDAINDTTAVVTLGPLHWADGTLFDLKAIRNKTNTHNALLVIDGSQSIGALPFSLTEIQADALVTVAYKWLMGPYSFGMAYYSDYFNEGDPIEDSWINRYNSEDFSGLVNYENRYQPKAGRYNMGEYSNFVNTPMLAKSMEQLMQWKPENIQHYCHEISRNAIQELRELGCFIEEANYRAKHLFGVYLPKHINLDKLKAKFKEENIYVSFRGEAIRVSCNVYNDASDFEKLIACFKSIA